MMAFAELLDALEHTPSTGKCARMAHSSSYFHISLIAGRRSSAFTISRIIHETQCHAMFLIYARVIIISFCYKRWSPGVRRQDYM